MKDSKTKDVGSVNQYGEVKLLDGSWKYVTKKMKEKGFVEGLRGNWDSIKVTRDQFLSNGFSETKKPNTVSFEDSRGRVHLVTLHSPNPKKVKMKGGDVVYDFTDIEALKTQFNNYTV